jgi:beta-aspartyl-peptidase (threonine type)
MNRTHSFIGAAFSAFLVLLSLKPSPAQAPPPAAKPMPIAIVVHGGAGDILRKDFSPEQDAAYRQALSLALKSGYDVLEKGGTSMDAVVTAIRVLEDSPLFNAGRGAVFTHSGRIQLDAAVMDGFTHKAGAVGAVEHVKNPIALARLVMEKSPHVLLVGSGADEFALEHGLEMVPQSYFKTAKRFQSLERQWRKKGAPWMEPGAGPSRNHGTVGCVALDRYGHLAAGTSTGGLTDKLDGRVGDTPIIGAGTYCDDDTCGVSCTGTGEFFQRYLIAYDLAERIRFKGMGLEQAADYEINKRLVEEAGADSGGLIALNRQGAITTPFNTAGMFRGWIDSKGRLEVALYADERFDRTDRNK